MNRDGVAERVAEGEVAAERSILGWEVDRYILLDEMIVQGVGVVATKPERYTPAKLCGIAQIDHGRAHREGDGLCVEDYRPRGTALGSGQADDVAVERSGGFDVGNLDTDEVGSDQTGHCGFPLRCEGGRYKNTDKYKGADMSSGGREGADDGAAVMGDPYATIGFALKQAQQALRTRLDTELREIGLTMPQYAVLAFLDKQPGASNAALARRAFVTPQTMQAILAGLERTGFVTRTPHPEHGRVQTTALTTPGAKVLAAATNIVADAEQRLRNAAAPLDPKVVTAMLLRIAEALR